MQLKPVWQYRELLFFLVWRDVKVRYKQTALGVAWVVLQPAISVLIFSVLFGMLLKAPSGDAPYPLFALSGLLPWQFFSGALSRTTTSVVDSNHLITKVYFPRLIIPLAAALAGLVDFGVGFGLLAVLMAIYRVQVSLAILALPLFLLLAIATALGFGLWFAALNVRYRDVKHLLPFVVQTWMYVTPVVYASQLIPERFRWLLGLNPMTGVVEGFRWALLGMPLSGLGMNGMVFWLSIVISALVLVGGLRFFRHTERTFADII